MNIEQLYTVIMACCRMVVALQREIHVFSFPTPVRRLLTLETRDNPMGLVEIATFATAQKQLLAFPGHKLGSVQLVDLGATEAGSSSAPVTLSAHQVVILIIFLYIFLFHTIIISMCLAENRVHWLVWLSTEMGP